VIIEATRSNLRSRRSEVLEFSKSVINLALVWASSHIVNAGVAV